MKQSYLFLVYVATIGSLMLIEPAAWRFAGQTLAGIPNEQWLEVVIRDYNFEIIHRTPVSLGGETVIIVRNQDIVRHGFTSPALAQLYLRAEGEGLASYGKGTEGFYVEPGRRWSSGSRWSGAAGFHFTVTSTRKCKASSSCSTSRPPSSNGKESRSERRLTLSRYKLQGRGAAGSSSAVAPSWRH